VFRWQAENWCEFTHHAIDPACEQIRSPRTDPDLRPRSIPPILPGLIGLPGDVGLGQRPGRLAEYALLPDNGLDYDAILAGYREPVPVESAAFWIYRLDAAVMLALLFNSEAPHAGLGPRSVDRLREVCLRLSRELGRLPRASRRRVPGMTPRRETVGP
jgi:hypothetical protein